MSGEWGSATEHKRDTCPIERRRWCDCGCHQRATHHGCANGVVLMEGCELSVRRWVREPASTLRCVWCQRPLVAHDAPCSPLTNRQMKAHRIAARVARSSSTPHKEGAPIAD